MQDYNSAYINSLDEYILLSEKKIISAHWMCVHFEYPIICRGIKKKIVTSIACGWMIEVKRTCQEIILLF